MMIRRMEGNKVALADAGAMLEGMLDRIASPDSTAM